MLKLESTFLGICEYDIFVSFDVYAKYFFSIQKRTTEDMKASILAHEDEEMRNTLAQYQLEEKDGK